MRVGAVLMASGFSVRFGSNKLLQQVDGASMIERTMASIPPQLFDRAAVVSPYPEILSLAEKRGYLPVPNPDAAQGQSASLRLGLARLTDMDGVLFAVCDQPWLEGESVLRLINCFREAPSRICALSWQGMRGNPAVFPARLFSELLALTGERGGGVVIRAHPDLLRLVEVRRAAELRDVDTPAGLNGPV